MCRVWPNVWLHDKGEGGIQPGMYSRFRTCVRQMTGGGMFHVQIVRGIWQVNRPRVQIRLVVLSNFYVENFFIRATDYFLWFFKVLNTILELLLNLKWGYCISMMSLWRQHSTLTCGAVQCPVSVDWVKVDQSTGSMGPICQCHIF